MRIELTAEHVLEAVAKKLGIPVECLTKYEKRSVSKVAIGKQTAAFLLKKVLPLSYLDISQTLGYSSKGYVEYCINTAINDYSNNIEHRILVLDIERIAWEMAYCEAKNPKEDKVRKVYIGTANPLFGEAG